MAIYSLLVAAFFASVLSAATATDFNAEKGNAWGGDRVKISENGNLLQLSLDQGSDAGYQFKDHYFYGRFDIQIKLIPGNSAGTVTSFYLQSPRPNNNEIDLEFLGNVSSNDPYVLHTNLWTQGTGDREQQFYLWFDPRQDFHTYSILWNPHMVVWYVDGTPIRVYRNLQGIPYPGEQPLHAYNVVWNGDEWATRRGRVKIDWSKAPFTASFRNYNADACVWSSGKRSCPSSSSRWYDRGLSSKEAGMLRSVRDKYMIYDYCNDPWHFPNGLPAECTRSG